MGKKKRFSTRAFCEAWEKHGAKTTNWNDFVKGMRAAAGDANYDEDVIRDRIRTYSHSLRQHRIAPPKYPKKRVPTAVAFFKSQRQAVKA